jgi:hypothetical protein
MWPHLPGGRDTLVYQAADATPASYAVLNFEVDDVDEAVDALARVVCASSATTASSGTRRVSTVRRAPTSPDSGIRPIPAGAGNPCAATRA